jgi:hypothetical protein
VRVLKTIGFDRHYVRASGPYLYDDKGEPYLDLLSGFGVFAVGRNHPTLIAALREVLEGELSGLVQMDVSVLAGILAERLLATAPGGLDKVFFANSGAEAVESAIKFARYHTGRPGLVYCDHGFHGLTMGAVSLNGDEIFREGFGPLLPGSRQIPFNDLAALERALGAARRRGVLRRADPGPRRERPRRRLPARGGAAVPRARHAVRGRRDPDRDRPDRPVLGDRALGRRARHAAHGEGALGRLRAGRRGAACARRCSTRCSPTWCARPCTARRSARTTSRWPRVSRRST